MHKGDPHGREHAASLTSTAKSPWQAEASLSLAEKRKAAHRNRPRSFSK